MRAFEHRVTHGSIATRARMKYTGAKRPLAALVLAIAIWPLASAAHSMREVEAALEAAEPAAEVVDEAAPDLVLEDARGRQVRLDDFRGRVVILDATFAARTNGCTASAGPMAKVRELVAQVPGLQEQVRFLTVGQHCEQGDPGANRVFVTHAPEAVTARTPIRPQPLAWARPLRKAPWCSILTGGSACGCAAADSTRCS